MLQCVEQFIFIPNALMSDHTSNDVITAKNFLETYTTN